MKMEELTQVPGKDRDRRWENQFFQALSQAKLKVIHEAPQQGPDGWPYLLVESNDEGGEDISKLLPWLATRGIGMVVNPQKTYPDYVFTFGMIWHYLETGLYFREVDYPTGQIEISGAHVVTGEPHPKYLPHYVRKIIADFLSQQGATKPRITMISQDQKHYDLAISLESLGNPPAEEHAGIAEALGWFLPPHYSLLLIEEKGLPPFYDLAVRDS